MSQIDHFLKCVEIYCAYSGRAEATLSSRVFHDGKRIAAIREGSDVGLRRMAVAMRWLSENWPEGLPWPEDVPRPSADTHREAAE